VPFLDHFDVPKPGALREWIGFSTVFALTGVAVLVMSLVGAAATYQRSWYQERAERRRESNDALENIQTLPKDQLLLLYSVLDRPRRFDGRHENYLLVELVRKKVLVTVGKGMNSWLCEVHPAILAERQRLLPVLRQACEMPGAFPKVQRQHTRVWTVASD